MRRRDLLGVLAGFSLMIGGLLLLTLSGGCGPVDPPNYSGAENPYALGDCLRTSGIENSLTLLSFLAIALLGGGLATRIGNTAAPWRGALAVGLACAVFNILGLLSTYRIIPTSELMSIVATTLFGALLGSIGGIIARRARTN